MMNQLAAAAAFIGGNNAPSQSVSTNKLDKLPHLPGLDTPKREKGGKNDLPQIQNQDFIHGA
eukprot:11823404-Ditylum_brightwellii.AAC.1